MLQDRTRVYLVRHGETELNQNSPGYCGWTDIELNAKGRAQAGALAQRFATTPLSVVLSSDLQRAADTARAIAGGRTEVQIDHRFRELNYGDWEGKSPETLSRDDPEHFRRWKQDPETTAPPGGETLQQVIDRAAPALQEWVEKHRGLELALVAHKTTVRLLLCWAMALPLSRYLRILQQNAAINVIEFRSDGPLVGAINDLCHLPPELISPAP